MKKLKHLNLFLAMLVVASGIYSCQKEPITTDEGPELTNIAASDRDPLPCETQCIDLNVEPVTYYPESGSAGGLIGMGGVTKSISYTVYNTASNFVVVLNYNRTPGTNNPTVAVTVNAVVQSQVLIENTDVTYTFPLSSGWAACDATAFSFVETIYDGSTPISSGAKTYNLRGVCNNCGLDGNTLSGAVNLCGYDREVVYTFSSEDGVGYYKMQGGLNAFTVETPTVTFLQGTGNVTITPVGNGNFIIKIEGALDECGTVQVKINWQSTNGDDEITGAWSVKDLDGNELATGVPDLLCL